MIDKKTNPVEWAILMYGLEDTKEHLSNLIDELHSKKYLDETDFKIKIGHIYSHLNRIYHSRNHVGEISDKEWLQYSRFPKDIEPI